MFSNYIRLTNVIRRIKLSKHALYCYHVMLTILRVAYFVTSVTVREPRRYQFHQFALSL